MWGSGDSPLTLLYSLYIFVQSVLLISYYLPFPILYDKGDGETGRLASAHLQILQIASFVTKTIFLCWSSSCWSTVWHLTVWWILDVPDPSYNFTVRKFQKFNDDTDSKWWSIECRRGNEWSLKGQKKKTNFSDSM